jgi:hypothetical protein
MLSRASCENFERNNPYQMLSEDRKNHWRLDYQHRRVSVGQQLLRASPNQHRKNLTCGRMSLSRVGRGNVSDGAARTFVRILYARLHKAGSGRGFLRWQTRRGSSEAVRWKNNQQHQARTVSAHRGKCVAMSAYRGEHGASSGPKISLIRIGRRSRSAGSPERTC